MVNVPTQLKRGTLENKAKALFMPICFMPLANLHHLLTYILLFSV